MTEFLPVSSSAHLVILQKIFGISGQELAIPVTLHLGTTLALILFFFNDILEVLINKKMIFYIIIVTLITGIVGISGRVFFRPLFASVSLSALALMVTGIILLFTRLSVHTRRAVLNTKDAFALGITQALAIIPGISRSGITISGLLFRGIEKRLAFKFSFLASIPAVLGAFILEAKEASIILKGNFLNLFIGFIFSFFCGLFSLWVLRKILLKAKLHYFGYYCIIVAILTFLFV